MNGPGIAQLRIERCETARNGRMWQEVIWDLRAVRGGAYRTGPAGGGGTQPEQRDAVPRHPGAANHGAAAGVTQPTDPTFIHRGLHLCPSAILFCSGLCDATCRPCSTFISAALPELFVGSGLAKPCIGQPLVATMKVRRQFTCATADSGSSHHGSRSGAPAATGTAADHHGQRGRVAPHHPAERRRQRRLQARLRHWQRGCASRPPDSIHAHSRPLCWLCARASETHPPFIACRACIRTFFVSSFVPQHTAY